ncbi:hypothetical protein MG290_00325 [Flavobacterium sp. CBA20B-1]|uniref:hypothetical protein n=1 Tax=unclassified Flavobacterium TaxID=196869 RepID=UPI0022248CC8|nr:MULTISPECIES: hypothetical protein [unclassified Flavobacterium]WCM42150.1 hypothetical protein MG290_00325 [Flavobacterium sp. CBA20B-1]
MYNRFNFFKNTFAVFKKADQPKDYSKPHFISKHGSCYFFTNEGVFRYSNHWGRVGNCRWRLEYIDHKQQTNYWGFCAWNQFYSNEDAQPLYFIEEVSPNQYTYNHKNNSNIQNAVYRSANETAKILKKINEINQNDAWAKHLSYNNYQDLKAYFINQLISTQKSFMKIKQEYIQANK